MLIISPLDITLCTSNTNLNIVIHHDVTSLYRTTDLQLWGEVLFEPQNHLWDMTVMSDILCKFRVYKLSVWKALNMPLLSTVKAIFQFKMQFNTQIMITL
jgi:hypothetical protein